MMKAKIFTLILFTAILSLAIVSAGVLTIGDITAPTSVNHNSGSFTISFPVTYAGQSASVVVDFDSSVFTSSTIGSIVASDITLVPGQTNTVIATINYAAYQSGKIEGKIVASDGSVDEKPFSVTILDSPSLNIPDVTISSSATKVNVKVENTGNIDFGNVLVEVEDITGVNFPVNSKTIPLTLEAGAFVNVEFDVNINSDNLDIGSSNIVVSASVPNSLTSANGKIIIQRTFCEEGTVGDLELSRLKFINNGMGDKDEWYLTDEIEVEVRVENTHSTDKIKNVIVSWGLYDEANKDWIIEDEESDFSLNDGEKKTVNFKFTLDPADFDVDYSEGDFVFYIKAYSDDDGEDVQCVSDLEDSITVKKEDDFLIVNDIVLDSDVLPCNEELSGDFTVWNIGGDDQDQELFVMVTNDELGINEKVNIGQLDVLEDIKRTFSVMVPENAKEKSYVLKFTVYDEDGDVFVNDGTDEDAVFTKIFNVEGECSGSTAKVQITAINDASTPKAVAGEKYIIKTTLINTDNKKATYSVSVFGNSAWSSLSSVEPQVVTLDAGESGEVSIVLNIDSDASGSKELTIRASTTTGETEQKVALNIEGNEVQLDAFSTHIKNNWFIYVIVLVNIVLIIAIILVIRSMVRPREIYE